MNPPSVSVDDFDLPSRPGEYGDLGFDIPRRVGQIIGQQTYEPRSRLERVGQMAVPEIYTPGHEAHLVAQALKNPNWDFRTLGSIAAETGLPRPTVERLLADNNLSRRPFGRPDADLFTAKDRPVSWRERLSLWGSFLAKRPR